MEEIIKELLTQEGGACLTFLVPTRHHSFAEKKETEILLKNTIREAEKILQQETDSAMAKSLKATLHKAAEEIDLTHSSESIACFITHQFCRILQLPFVVEKKVILSRTFELQELLYNLDHLTPYYALHLSRGCTRLFRGLGPNLSEITDDNFPTSFVNDHQKVRTSPYAAHSADHSKVALHYWQDFFRKIHHLVTPYVQSSPLILLGVHQDIALYEKIAKSENILTEHIYGNYDKEPLHKINQLVWPLIFQAQQAKNAALLKTITQKINLGEAVYGVEAVLQAINTHNKVHLFVEKDFEIPGYFDSSSKQLNLVLPLSGNYRKVPNLIEHILEAVLRKSAGKITLLNRNLLKEYAHIAALTKL